MSGFNRLTMQQSIALALACLLSMPSATLLAANRKGDKLLNEARQEEAKGIWIMRFNSPDRRWNRTHPIRVTSWKCVVSGSKTGRCT